MYSQQLEREIEKLQTKYVDNPISSNNNPKVRGYHPFLGMVSYDEIDDAVESSRHWVRQSIWKSQSECKSFKNETNWSKEIYFFVVNSALANEMGEHWFLVGFCPNVKLKLFIYNTYGAAHTAKILGYGLHINSDDKTDEEKRNKTEYKKTRKAVLFDIAKEVWPEELNTLLLRGVSIIDLKGSHQDASTDECGYHVFRFIQDLFKHNLFPGSNQKQIKNCQENPQFYWHEILMGYIERHSIESIHYQLGRPREETQPLLLKNDQKVREQVEDRSRNSEYKIQNPENEIQVHEEYNLTDKEWYDFFESIALSYGLIVEPGVINTDEKDLTIEFKLKFLDGRMSTQRKKGGKYKMSKSKRKLSEPYYNHISGRINANLDETLDEEFDRLYAKHLTSSSKKLIEAIFPAHRGYTSNRTPILQKQNIASDDPNFLDNIYIELPGDPLSMTSIGTFYNNLGIVLDPKDPYTFQLAMMTRDYFDNHTDKNVSREIMSRLNKKASQIWKNVS